MEFYFSDANLHKDGFLGKLVKQSPDGCKFGDHFVAVDSRSAFIILCGITTKESEF